MTMRDWLTAQLRLARNYFLDVENYVLGRGIPESLAMRLGIGMWPEEQPEVEAPDSTFRERYGDYGERLHGKLITPLYTPRGQVLGFEARSMAQKALTRFLLPEAEWNPMLLGLDFHATRKLYEGADVWIGEGLFDLGALRHVVPPEDVVLASMTARLSRKQVEYLRRYCQGLVNMVFDEDETGRKGIHGVVDADTGRRKWGALESLEFVGLTCRDIRYRGGKDPGEIWERTGTQGLRKALSNYL